MAHSNICITSGSWSPHGSGRSSAISRSNKINKMATRKNRIENGSRADPKGSNPHSYGESFSESGFICGSQNDTIIKIHESREVINIIEIIGFITSPWLLAKI